jgi:hypothetical protein
MPLGKHLPLCRVRAVTGRNVDLWGIQAAVGR